MKSPLMSMLFLFALSISACQTQGEHSGSILGKISYGDEKMIIEGAHVTLTSEEQEAYSDNYGWYKLDNVRSGLYIITVTKSGFAMHESQVTVKPEQSTTHNISLYPALSIKDINGESLSKLDFGDTQTTLSFSISNIGIDNISCTISHSSQWLNVSDVVNPIIPGDNRSVIASIDRTKLAAGDNNTTIIISTNNIKKAISVIAKCEYQPPIVETLPMSAHYGNGSNGWVDTFNGRIIFEGKPSYYQKGFCFSSTNPVPTVWDNLLIVDGGGIGYYSDYAFTFWVAHPQRETYYSRAFVLYGEGQVEYGDVISFVFNPMNLEI